MDNTDIQSALKRSNSLNKQAGLATDLVLNTAIGGMGGNLLGQATGGAVGLGGPNSAIIGTLVGASSGTLATILDYIHNKKRGRYYYIPDEPYSKKAGLGKDLLYNMAIGGFGGGILGDALGDFADYNQYAPNGMKGGTLGALLGSGAGAVIAVRDYLRNKKEENKKRKS